MNRVGMFVTFHLGLEQKTRSVLSDKLAITSILTSVGVSGLSDQMLKRGCQRLLDIRVMLRGGNGSRIV